MDIDFLKSIKLEYDALTNIYGRRVITEYMNYLLTKNIPFAFSILDVDNFKYINDTYGHLAGDDVLRIVAKSLEEISSEFGVVGRYGGDEFIFVIPNVSEYDDVWQCGFQLLKSTSKLNFPNLPNLSVTYTMGMARFPTDATNLDDLFTLADKALYRGKIKGRNCFIIYLPEKHKDIDVLNKRDKIYSPIYLNGKIYNMLASNQPIEKSLPEAITFVGSSLMIDHLCYETDQEIKYTYLHPLAKKFDGYEVYGYDDVAAYMDTNGFFIENVTLEKYNSKGGLYKKFKDQGIYSSVICDVKAFGKHYGFLRADMTAVDTGRIWQQSDLVLLINFANILGLVLANNEKNQTDD